MVINLVLSHRTKYFFSYLQNDHTGHLQLYKNLIQEQGQTIVGVDLVKAEMKPEQQDGCCSQNHDY